MFPLTITFVGGFSLVRVPFPLKMNSTFGAIFSVDATDAITVILSRESIWFSLTYVFCDSPIKFIILMLLHLLRCNGI